VAGTLPWKPDYYAERRAIEFVEQRLALPDPSAVRAAG
jgi:hypothetical protein